MNGANRPKPRNSRQIHRPKRSRVANLSYCQRSRRSWSRLRDPDRHLQRLPPNESPVLALRAELLQVAGEVRGARTEFVRVEVERDRLSLTPNVGVSDGEDLAERHARVLGFRAVALQQSIELRR